MQRFLSPLICVAKNYETVLHLIKDSTEEEVGFKWRASHLDFLARFGNYTRIRHLKVLEHCSEPELYGNRLFFVHIAPTSFKKTIKFISNMPILQQNEF